MKRRSEEEIRESALDGAAACFRDLGVAGTSVEDIVRASGVPRSTLYRHVGDRNDLLLAVTLREIEQLRADLVARLSASPSVVEVLVEGVLGAVELVQTSAVLHELVVNPALVASEVSDRGLEALMAYLFEFVEPLAVEHQGSVRSDLDPAVAVECLVRTIASLVTMRVRSDRSQDDLRRYLGQTLVPVFVPDAILDAAVPASGQTATTT